MASCKLGHVYIVMTTLSRPAKEKYAICVCIDDDLFVWINTNAAPHGRDQLPIPAGCHELVKHDSHVDLSKIWKHRDWELEDAKEFPCISSELCTAIVQRVEAGLDVLSPRHAEIILTNLRKLNA